MSDHRRFEDTPAGKVIYSWPALVGLSMALMAVGGYLATLKLQDKHLEKIDQWIDVHEKNNAAQSILIQHLSDLEDSQDRRVTTLENNFDRFLSHVDGYRPREKH